MRWGVFQQAADTGCPVELTAVEYFGDCDRLLFLGVFAASI